MHVIHCSPVTLLPVLSLYRQVRQPARKQTFDIKPRALAVAVFLACESAS